MLLDCQSVLRQVLDQELVLEIVCLLSHLDDHVLLVGRSFGHAWARWAEGRCLLLMHQRILLHHWLAHEPVVVHERLPEVWIHCTLSQGLLNLQHCLPILFYELPQ